MLRSLFSSFAIIIVISSCAQSSSKMDFETYDPVSTLVVPEHKLTKAKFLSLMYIIINGMGRNRI